MRYLILAQGGVDARWQNPDGSPWLGVPKHLLPVDGETLLGRTVRMLRDRGVRDIVVTAPEGDPRYRFPGAQTITQDQSGWTWPGLNALHGTRELWAPRSRTTILFGDVFYSDGAMDRIVSCDAAEPHFYRRPWASSLTGHPWDEPFALSFLPEHHDLLHDTALRLVNTGDGKRIPLWRLLGALHGVWQADHHRDVAKLPGQTHIDDWTDDIDTPRQAVSWLGRYYRNRVDVTVIMSWSNRTGCHHRQLAFAWCRKWWQKMGVPIIVATDDDGDYFNLSTCRNRGVHEATSEVVVLADSDTVIPSDQFWAGAYLASQTSQMVLPYTTYRRLNRVQTDRAFQEGKLSGGHAWSNHVSGVVAMRRDAYERIRYDERAQGWAPEDRMFYLAARTMLGEHDRLPGDSFHLWHPASAEATDRESERWQANRELAQRYRAAGGVEDDGWVPTSLGDPEAMAALLTEPGGPQDPNWQPKGRLLGPGELPKGLTLTYQHRSGRTETVRLGSGRQKRLAQLAGVWTLVDESEEVA